MSTGPGGVEFPAGHVVKTGTQMALGGLLGPFLGNFAVLANPLLLFSCILVLLRRTRGAILCLAFAVPLALQTFQLMTMPYHEDEGGVLVSYMVHPLAGWYCWFGAILLALTLAVVEHLSAPQQSTMSEIDRKE
ncbi:hypothetical protein AciX8_2395 [Granulicella mallensis MP5ACTX8]|uniref:Uncharacterized protein n=1 Tax=Granulicella mallensis (strain ATCC BAA-1857 / DSM 23137 / MP5ACTX8) TaxID=682795 RepID=G8NY38_GRAMM|nr:hypothetical protein AciX8_2395 [Granulicella mallensis MP5ACTX8]